MDNKINVLGYFVHKDDKEINASTVMVFIDSNLRNGKLEGYCPIGQHFESDRGYFEECKKITKEQYKEASKLFYTPAEYLV